MSDSSSQALNQLVAIFTRSLSAYLTDAAPWSNGKDESGFELLSSLAADQRAMVDKIAEHLIEHGVEVNQGAFPMQFTDLHDLALDYLLGLAAKYQQADLEKIQGLAAAFADDAAAKELFEEALGTAKGHLDALRDYVQKSAA